MCVPILWGRGSRSPASPQRPWRSPRPTWGGSRRLVLHLHRAGRFRDRLLSRANRARLTVASSEIDQLESYYHLLTRWNRTINLTALALEPLGDYTLDR